MSKNILRNVYGDMVRAGIAASIPANATAEEAAKIAGLDWQMVDVPLAAFPDTNDEHNLSGIIATDVFGRFRVNNDGSKPSLIATVGRRTEQLPNAKVFGVFDSLIQSGRAEWTSAGSFNNGAKVWAQVSMLQGSTFDIRPNDALEFKPTALNFNDGGGSAAIGFSVTRVVCQNTFRLAYQGDSIVKIRHSKQILEKWDVAAKIFEYIGTQADVVEKCKFLASKGNIDKAKLNAYIVQLFGMTENDKGSLPKQSQRKIDEITRLFESGTGNKGKDWFDAYNAITEHLTYDAGRGVESRTESLWFGANAGVADEAFRLALEMAA